MKTWKPKNREWYWSIHRILPHMIEQCTGLKDANGKLIYENDILQTPSCRYRVKYDDKTCGFVCDEYLDGCSALLLHSDLASKKYRVVGNIHKSPEILEDKK